MPKINPPELKRFMDKKLSGELGMHHGERQWRGATHTMLDHGCRFGAAGGVASLVHMPSGWHPTFATGSK